MTSRPCANCWTRLLHAQMHPSAGGRIAVSRRIAPLHLGQAIRRHLGKRPIAVIAGITDCGRGQSRRPATRQRPLVGAARLGAGRGWAHAVGCARAQAEVREPFGKAVLHWTALLGEDRLAGRLIGTGDRNLKGEKYKSPLGWAIHAWCNRPPEIAAGSSNW